MKQTEDDDPIVQYVIDQAMSPNRDFTDGLILKLGHDMARLRPLTQRFRRREHLFHESLRVTVRVSGYVAGGLGQVVSS